MALRVAGALPSVLECCSLSPSYSQVVAAKMLLLITQHFTEPPELNGGSIDLTFEGSGSGSSMGLPTLGSFLTSSCGFLHQRLGSCDGALRLESARSLLSIISLVKVSPNFSP